MRRGLFGGSPEGASTTNGISPGVGSRVCISGLLNSRIEVAVQDVGSQVEHDHGGTEQQKDGLDHVVVEVLDSTVRQQAQARPRVDGLDDDGASEDEAETVEDERERRQEGVRD